MKTIAICLLPFSLLIAGCPDSGDGPDARVEGPDAGIPDSSVPAIDADLPDADLTLPDAQVATPDAMVVPPVMLNGCDSSTALDLTGMAMTTISFPTTPSPTVYTPPCIRVSAGTNVRFSGSFTFHPLRGGTVVGGVGTEDPSSPITATSSGMMASFDMTTAGNFGFYCNIHVSLGMMGAIFVE